MSPRTRGVLLVACAGLLWSTLGLGVRLMEEATAWQIVFYRGLFQALAVTGWVLHRHRGRVLDAFRSIGWAGVVAALGLGTAYNGMILALSLTSVATVVFVLGATPLVTGVLAWWLLRERVRPATGVAMAIALSGIMVMTFGGSGAGHGLGILAAGVAVLGNAVFAVALRYGRAVDMLPAVALAGLVAALLSAPWVSSLTLTPRDLALCAYLGGFALAVGLALFTVGSRSLSAVELPLIAMTESVLAPVWVWVVLGEKAAAATLLGGALVLGAVLLQALQGDRTTTRAEPAVAEP
ncbi:MAG: DMT family transporter [Myxococcota bacterium]